MTKRTFNATIIAILSLLISSCKKDRDQKEQNKCDLVKEVMLYDYNDKISDWTLITYDTKGRVTFVKSGFKDQVSYSYSDGKIEMDETDIHGVNNKVTFFLDGRGRITGTSYFNNDCKYDSEGYLISYRQPYGYKDQINGYVRYNLVYENGNLVEVNTSNSDVAVKKITLTYYQKPAQELTGLYSPLYLSNILGLRNYFLLVEAGFYGKRSKNLVKSANYHDGIDRPDFEGQFDGKGRIVRMQNFGFKYQCD